MKKFPALFFLVLSLQFANAQRQQYKTAIIAFYNCENFYDTIDNPVVKDEDLHHRAQKLQQQNLLG